jgi:predicted alpha/beta hydrolase
MPERWARFTFYLKGHEDPVEVQTTMRDWAQVKMDPAAGLEAMELTFQVIWFALRRTGVEVPNNFHTFLDDEWLEGPPESVDGTAPALDPTNAAVSDAPL